ncbi:MAG: hypothetical protein QOI92_2560 [Chloroflexota bacterium]|nr:hypothetical protein [Chloroflexota bacterium]
MVTALVVQDATAAATSARTGASPIVSAAHAAGSTALLCRIV